MCCSTTHPAIIEVAARLGHDYVILDAEHAAMDRQTLELLVRTAEAHDLVSIVKLKDLDPVEIRDALDSGALGLMAPHIKDAGDMRALMDAAYFPPLGRRGVCGATRANAYSAGDLRELVRMTNEELLLIPVLEDREAVENLESILSVHEGIEIYDIGPVDLAASLGLDLNRSITNPSPELSEKLEVLLAGLKARGKHVMYPTRFPNMDASAQEVRESMRERGVTLLYGFDTHCLVSGARQLLATKGPLSTS